MPSGPDCSLQSAARADAAAGSVEGGEQAVAGAFDDDAPVLFDGLSRGVVVLFEQRAPGSITDRRGAGGRVDDVGEEHRREHSVDFDFAVAGCAGDELGDRVDDRIVVTGEAADVEVARDLDEVSIRDVLGEVSPVSDRDDRIAGAVHDERRHAHGAERVADVHVHVVAQDLCRRSR